MRRSSHGSWDWFFSILSGFGGDHEVRGARDADAAAQAVAVYGGDHRHGAVDDGGEGVVTAAVRRNVQDKYLNKEEYLRIAKEDSARTIIIFNPPRNEWMKSWIKMPHMTVASDSMWSTDETHNWHTDPTEYSGHPRTSGTHATVLRMGREQGVPLMFSLSQLSYWSALHLGQAGLESLKVRGRLQEGMVADIVVFDPETVAEESDYKSGKNGLPPKGLPHVIVNGQFVKRDNKATNVMAGQPIRYPVEEKGRFVPASTEQWLQNFTIDTSPIKPRAK